MKKASLKEKRAMPLPKGLKPASSPRLPEKEEVGSSDASDTTHEPFRPGEEQNGIEASSRAAGNASAESAEEAEDITPVATDADYDEGEKSLSVCRLQSSCCSSSRLEVNSCPISPIIRDCIQL